MKHIIYSLLLLIGINVFISDLGLVMADQNKSLQEWTGAHSRLVWVQDQGNGSDTFARSKKLALYGYDSVDGKGERMLIKGTRNYFKPIFTPDGKKVIYSDRKDRQMFLLDWESGKVKKLGSGVAVAVWKDTKKSFLLKKSTTWVYCFDGLQPENKYGTAQSLYRFPLGKPKKKELVWNKTNMAWSNVQLSRDGKLLGGLFPWPHGGVVHTENKEFKRLGRGCWTSISPDNSKLLWIFDGLHRNIQMHNVETSESWKVNINSAPGIGGFEVYHPRWSNHARFFVMTGPYEKGEGGNKLRGGGDKVEIHIGRFDDKAQSVEDWFKVTNNTRADFYPAMWVEGGENYNLFTEKTHEVAVVGARVWPQSSENLLYVWEDMKAGNQLSETSPVGFYQCNLTLKGNALFTRDLTFSASGGWGETGDAGVKIGQALAKSGKAALELLVTPAGKQKGTFFTLQAGDGNQLSIQQDEDSLVVYSVGKKRNNSQVVWDKVFTTTDPAHLVLNIADGQAELFENGTSLGRKKLPVDFGSFLNSQLILGDTSDNWKGNMSNVAVYQAPLVLGDVQNNSAYISDKLKKIKPIQTLIVEARLAETTEIPAPDAIGAYRRALVVNSYDVEKVVDGEYEEDKIVIAEWAVLDRQIVKQYSDKVAVERLVLEAFDDHPELEGERQMMDIFEPDLTMYYRLN